MNILPTECACDRCSRMCQAPCCGTPQEINALIKAGYGDRLMLDDWPEAEDMVKPAMKGSESYRAPWATKTEDGCTFWKEGKCELHDTGLKPMHARLAHHDNTDEDWEKICYELQETWQGEEAEICISNWKKEYYKGRKEDDDEAPSFLDQLLSFGRFSVEP